MIRLHVPITKIDVAKRLVIGRLAQEMPDRAGEILDYEKSKPYFTAWSDGFVKATTAAGQEVSCGNLRAMHGKVAAGKFTQIVCNDAEKAFDVIAKVVDAQEWEKCVEGVYTAFSIGGDYVGEKKAEKINGKTFMRYTANPGEGSLVDSPCIPSARFFEIVKADGSVLQKAFQAPVLSPADIVAAQNALVEKVARRLARQGFWKLPPAMRVQLPDDVFQKMDAAEQARLLAKSSPDEAWQAHVLEAIRLVKSGDSGDDLEKPDEIDQEEWDDMDDEEKQAAVDEYGKALAAKLKKAEDEKDLVKPDGVTQDDWNDMTGVEKRKQVEEAAANAAKAAKAAALAKTEEDELRKDFPPKKKAEVDPEDQADGGVDENQEGMTDEEKAEADKKKKIADAEKAAKAAGAADPTLSAVEELAKLLDSGKITPEALLAMAKAGNSAAAPPPVAASPPVTAVTAVITAAEVPAATSEETAMRTLATMHKVASLRKQLEDPDIKLTDFHKVAVAAVGEDEWKTGGYFQKYVEDRAGCIEAILTKAGARHSSVDKEHLQQAHDHLTSLGATCNKDNLSVDDAEKVTGNGGLLKLAIQSAEQISNMQKQLDATTAEVVRLRNEPVRPKGVSRVIGKGQDGLGVEKSAEVVTLKVARPGEHNEQLAIDMVRKQVADTSAFRNY